MSAIEIEHVSYRGRHGTIEANIARPELAQPVPALILLHEAFGVTKPLRELALHLAEHGYLALLPDLYSRDARRKRLEDDEVIRALPLAGRADREATIQTLGWHEQESARRVLGWFEARDASSLLDDAQASLNFLKRHALVEPQAISCIGFSMGAGLTFELAAHNAELASGVAFYGPSPARETLGNIRCPCEAHYAEDDPAITPHAVVVEEALRGVGTPFRYFVYPGTQHGFSNRARPTYHAASAALALGRTLEFLSDTLTARGGRARGGATRSEHG